MRREGAHHPRSPQWLSQALLWHRLPLRKLAAAERSLPLRQHPPLQALLLGPMPRLLPPRAPAATGALAQAQRHLQAQRFAAETRLAVGAGDSGSRLGLSGRRAAPAAAAVALRERTPVPVARRGSTRRRPVTGAWEGRPPPPLQQQQQRPPLLPPGPVRGAAALLPASSLPGVHERCCDGAREGRERRCGEWDGCRRGAARPHTSRETWSVRGGERRAESKGGWSCVAIHQCALPSHTPLARVSTCPSRRPRARRASARARRRWGA